MIQYQLINANAGLQRLLRDLGRVLIADYRIQGRHHADAMMYLLTATILVSDNTVHATGTQGIETIDQQIHGLEAALCHHRLHGVQLHLGGFPGHGHT